MCLTTPYLLAVILLTIITCATKHIVEVNLVLPQRIITCHEKKRGGDDEKHLTLHIASCDANNFQVYRITFSSQTLSREKITTGEARLSWE